MGIIWFFPEAAAYLFLQFVVFFIVQHDKLLISWRIDMEGVPFFGKALFLEFCHLDGVFTDFEIQVIGKEGIKLHACQAAFCQ